MEKQTVRIKNQLEFPNSSGIEFIKKEICLLIDEIEKKNSFEETILIFNILGEIQYILAKAIFKNDLELDSSFKKFIHDFDRIDDDEVKKYLFKKIKAKEYELM
jgi:hypothetical protein